MDINPITETMDSIPPELELAVKEFLSKVTGNPVEDIDNFILIGLGRCQDCGKRDGFFQYTNCPDMDQYTYIMTGAMLKSGGFEGIRGE